MPCSPFLTPSPSFPLPFRKCQWPRNLGFARLFVPMGDRVTASWLLQDTQCRSPHQGCALSPWSPHLPPPPPCQVLSGSSSGKAGHSEKVTLPAVGLPRLSQRPRHRACPREHFGELSLFATENLPARSLFLSHCDAEASTVIINRGKAPLSIILW